MGTEQHPPQDPSPDPGRGTAAAPFAGLPDGLSRFEFVRLAREIGSSGGWTPALIAHLDLLLSWTRAQDWEPGGRPVVWLSVNATAARLGVCTSTVRNHERVLAELGAITVTPAANRRRCGHRREDGTIAWAWGVDLAPLLEIWPRLEREAAEQRERAAFFTQARMEALDLQRRIRAAIDAAVGAGAGVRGAVALRERIRLLAQKWARCRRIEGILAWCRLLERLLGRILRVDGGRAADGFATGFPAERKRISRRMQPKLATQDDYLLIPPDSYQVGPEAGAETPSPPSKHAAGGDCLQGGRGGGPRNPAGGSARGSRVGSEKVPIGAIADLAAASGVVWIEDANNWHELVDAAARACNELGIQQASWAEACQTMGRFPAAAAVILIALKFERELVWAPDGYLRAMTWRAWHGQLHLARSVFGWLIEVSKGPAKPSGRGIAAT